MEVGEEEGEESRKVRWKFWLAGEGVGKERYEGTRGKVGWKIPFPISNGKYNSC